MSKHEAWRRLLAGDTGIAKIQERILDEISIRDLPYEKLKELRERFESEVEKDETSVPSENLHIRGDVNFIEYVNTLRLYGPVGSFEVFPIYFHPSSYEDNADDLLVTAGVLREITGQYLQSTDFRLSQPEDTQDENISHFFTNTMLDSKEDIILDNIQTLLDVYRVFTHGEADVNIKHKIMKDICTRSFKKRIVRENETPLEIAARAPFSFWAEARHLVPVSYKGKPIIENGLKYNADFLKYIATGNLSTTELRNWGSKRNGGCPVLHRDFVDLNLINRFGQQFVDLHRRLYIDKA